MGDYLTDRDPFDGERLDLPEWTPAMTILVLNPGPVLELTDGKGSFWEVSARSERLTIVGNLLTNRAALDVQEGDSR